MRSIAVVVHAAVEHGGSVLADGAADEGAAARVFGDEVADVVDDAGDGDPGAAALLGLRHVVVPRDDGQLVERHAPVELRALAVQLLLVHLETALFDFVGP